MTQTNEYQITFDEFKEVTRATIHATATRLRRGVFGWILFIGLAIGFFVMIQNKSPGNRRAPSQISPFETLIWLVPWLLALGFIWFFVYRALHKRTQRLFDNQPALHRRTVVEFDEKGICETTPVSRTETTWEAFTKFRETGNTFVLHHSDLVAMIVPKRAFQSADDLDLFRRLLERHIAPRDSAFPVIRRESAST